jgi:soluble lytic murein transglycosylase-like protein
MMSSSKSHSWILAAAVLVVINVALPAQSALARTYSDFHHYRHHYAHVLPLAEQQNPTAPFGLPFLSPFGANAAPGSDYATMVAAQASANGVPASLVHRIIMRESRYNPRAVSRGNYGIMQIRLGTARAMGYGGSADGLLDAATNMTYAVRYLAGAYRAAGGNENRAVALYARGYYAEAKAQGFSAYASSPD